MKREIVEYSGYLAYRPLSSQRLEEARRVVADAGYEFDVESGWLEIEYAGRDANRRFVTILAGLARIIGDAQGEIVCELDREGADREFEFYSIRGGKLLRRRGHVVRDQSEEVVGEREVHQVAVPGSLD